MKNFFWILILFFFGIPNLWASNGTSTGDGLGSTTTPPGGPGGGPIDLPNPLSADTIAGALDKIINFLLAVAAPVAIIMTVWAGYLFLASGGSEEKVITARKTLLYVVIGVAVLILSKGLISLVTSIL